MPAQIKLLVGAPLHDDCLDASAWSIDELLPAFLQHVKPTGDHPSPGVESTVIRESDPSMILPWRSLNPNNLHLASKFSPLSWTGHMPLGHGTTSAQFYQASTPASARDSLGMQWQGANVTESVIPSVDETSELSNAYSEDCDDESFLEQSFAKHEFDAGLTEISPGSDPTAFQLQEATRDAADRLDVFRDDLTVLSAIPNAQTLIRLNPQTVTLNMLVAVISAPPRRTVSIRRSGRDAQLLELVVGDDTRAGLQVTLWLDALEREKQRGEAISRQCETSASLRSGDIVLLENVALAHFRGTVYGQSLRRHWARGGWATNVSVVCRRAEYARTDMVPTLSGELSPIQQRLVAVQVWARCFVLLPPRASMRVVGGNSRLEHSAQDGVAGGSLPPNETP